MNIYYSQNGYNYLNELLKAKNYSKIFVLTDTNTNEHCSAVFLSELVTETQIEIIEIEAGETHKNLSTCTELWNILIEFKADRKSLIIGLGGGVITDIAGFVASVFKRGIDFINVPTSLLGMVDASLGGKTGVDLGNLKNQIGTITNAQMVLIDFRFLDTLPDEEIRSGYAEMLKHGLIQDRKYWEKLSDFRNIDLTELDQLIIRSVEIKTKITSEDLSENGIRKALNYGHTLGHAIESYCMTNSEKPTLLHGEAIAIGMILESFLSFKKRLISAEDYLEIKSVLKEIYPFVKFDKKDIEAIIELLSFDKKNEYGKILFVLLDQIGTIKIDQQIENELIFSAFDDYNS
ncbi:MAG: 3-dehydroquinate synthase [Flavobacteriaceae bacterium]